MVHYKVKHSYVCILHMLLSKAKCFLQVMHYTFPRNRTNGIGIARAAGIPKMKMTEKDSKWLKGKDKASIK